MKPVSSENALYKKVNNKDLSVLTRLYVDDCLNDGDKRFETSTKRLSKLFQLKPNINDNLHLFGTRIKIIDFVEPSISNRNTIQEIFRRF